MPAPTQPDYFEDSSPAKQPAAAENRSEDESTKTALLPSSLCPGMEVGDMINLRVVRVHEDQYEVEYEPSGEKKKEEPMPMAPPEGGQSEGGGMYE